MRKILSAFSFQGETGRLSYAATVWGAFFAQHAVIAFAAYQLHLFAPPADWSFWINPLRTAAFSPAPSEFWGPLVMPLLLVVDWLIAAASYRRVRDTGLEPWIAAATVVLLVQLPVMAWLCFAPRKTPGVSVAEPAVEQPVRKANAGSAALGLMIGVGICIAVASLSLLVFRVYGYAVFLAGPFVVGVTTAYVAGRRTNLSGGATAGVVMGALTLGGFALLALAIEGALCLAFASPLIYGAGLVGAAFGHAAAESRRRASGVAVMSLAILPLLIVTEALLPPKAAFDSVQSVDVAASPEAVWDAIVHMGPIPDAPDAPFNLGVAYPVAGEIDGEGVGAVRRGVFSTGVAYEKVTDWQPGQKLWFDVLSDPPMIREISPYSHVHAPHTAGYFKTAYAHFDITPLPSGLTRLSLTTRHEVNLEPAFYWLPVAQWATHTNKQRVLNHFRRQAEGR